MVPLAAGLTVDSLNPVAVIVSLEPLLTLMLNKPEASAFVAFLVPVSRIVAKGIDSPLSSLTCPVTVTDCWPNTNADRSISTVHSDAIFLM